jgi:hypothetical protein
VGSSPDQDVFCSSEIKHDKGMARISKASGTGDYRNEGNDPKETVLGRFSVKMCSVDRKLSTTEKRHKEQNCFVSGRRLQELRTQARKNPWVRDSAKMMDLGISFL